jgi:Icc-related predicted phosphoesterase
MIALPVDPQGLPMKWLFVSDLHYALKQFDWVVSQASRFDLVVIGGDFLDISSDIDAQVQSVVVLKYLRQLREKTRVLVCSGNHDLDARNADGEKYARWLTRADALDVHSDGSTTDVDGTLFTVCPWWDGPATRARVGELLARDAIKPKSRWVWIYHSPPDNSPVSWVGDRHIGDDALSGWIARYQPDMVMTGHIHQSPFVRGGSWVDRLGKTWVFNPGRQIGAWPAHIMVGMDAAEAVWVSLAGGEIVRLDAPLTRPLGEITSLPAWLA